MSKFFFLDTNAIARYYCNDIGTHIIKQIVNSQNGIIVSNYSFVEVISAFAQLKRDETFPTFGEAEYNSAVSKFEAEYDSKFVPVQVNETQFKKAVDLIKNYSIRSADALIVATSLLVADKIAQKGHELTFVTSDKQPYNVAVEEANKRGYYRAFHFWKCNCPGCGNILNVKKAKEVTCSCEATRCDKCQIGNCTNTLMVDLLAI